MQGRLEESRALGKIGSSLAAEVEIQASGEDFVLLDSLGDDLRLILVTSEARVVRSEDPQGKVEISVMPCVHPKCERCWHYRADVGIDADHPRYAVDAYPIFSARARSGDMPKGVMRL